MRRVFITGLGAVTGFGYGMGTLWSALLEGRSCLAPIDLFDASGFASRLGGQARDFSVKDLVPKHYRKAIKVMARDTELAVAAAADAVASAGLVTKATDPEAAPTYAPERVGCQIGAGLIAADVGELGMAMSASVDDAGAFSYARWGDGGMENLTPLWLLKYLPNMLACHVTILHDCRGPSNTITCSEASGGLSIGEAMRVIQRGDADMCFAGGAESKLNPMGFARMDFAGRLARTGAEVMSGSSVVRPFDPQASGTVLGEGGGILALEAEDTAASRGALRLAEVAGFGAGQSPMDDDAESRAEGLVGAIEAALGDAGIGAGEVGAIVPQALGARGVDAQEAHALRRVFGGRLKDVPLVTVTPAIGDLVAGAMGVTAAVGAKVLHEQMLPARIHAGRPDPLMQAGRSGARAADLEHVVVTTTALGGQNAALVLRRAR